MTLFSTQSLLTQVRAADSHSPMVQRNASCSSNIQDLLVLLAKRSTLPSLPANANFHPLPPLDMVLWPSVFSIATHSDRMRVFGRETEGYIGELPHCTKANFLSYFRHHTQFPSKLC